MKISTLTLNNFRAFPGPVAQAFNIDGKNLLIYGENEAGKSPVFHALKTFFTLNHPDHTDEIGESACLYTGKVEVKAGTQTATGDGELTKYAQVNKGRMSNADAPEVVTEIRNAYHSPHE